MNMIESQFKQVRLEVFLTHNMRCLSWATFFENFSGQEKMFKEFIEGYVV